MSDDILEIGADGTFELPSPTRENAKKASKPELIVPSSEQIDLILNEINSKSVFDSMNPNEYRIFKDNGLIKIVIKVGDGLKPISVTWSSSSNELHIETDQPNRGLIVNVDPDFKANMTKLTSKYSSNILIISTTISV